MSGAGRVIWYKVFSHQSLQPRNGPDVGHAGGLDRGHRGLGQVAADARQDDGRPKWDMMGSICRVIGRLPSFWGLRRPAIPVLRQSTCFTKKRYSTPDGGRRPPTSKKDRLRARKAACEWNPAPDGGLRPPASRTHFALKGCCARMLREDRLRAINQCSKGICDPRVAPAQTGAFYERTLPFR